MRICVLQPDYSTTSVDYKNYDPPRDLSQFLPEATIDNVFLNKLTTYKQLKALKNKGYDCFVNLCEGYLEWEVPSIDVIYTLELLNMPFTGPTSLLYDPPKELMKYVAYTEGVKTPAYALIESENNISKQCRHLKYPLFVKPSKAGDSLGVDEKSMVQNEEQLIDKVNFLLQEYESVLVEEYIKGREFTVLIAANADNHKQSTAFTPVEFIFPEGRTYKTYALKTSELHPECNVPVKAKRLSKQLKEAAQKIFRSFGAVGYARMDFRMNEKGELFFLEVNFTCSVFYSDGMEGSADYILKHDGIGQHGFLRHIIAEGISRHRRKQKKYVMNGNSIVGFGIYASTNIIAGDIIFRGEEKPQRIVTKSHVEKFWSDDEKKLFRQYAYPVSNEVYILWDNNPSEWAPQNHSCEPNTVYQGLDVIAIRNISVGEELTLDYAELLNDESESFDCQCGTASCRGLIQGVNGNSVTLRLQPLVLSL
ncbi:MAG: SET domain-containing protein-lysine N-methyltransferase [Ferruginibacter sp.]